MISEASHLWIPSPATQIENLQSPDDGKTLGRIGPAGSLGTDISQPKGLFEDDVPFLKVGYVSVPWRVIFPPVYHEASFLTSCLVIRTRLGHLLFQQNRVFTWKEMSHLSCYQMLSDDHPHLIHMLRYPKSE